MLGNLPLFYAAFEHLPGGVDTRDQPDQLRRWRRYNWYGPDSHLRVLAGTYRDPMAQWLPTSIRPRELPRISGSFLNLTHYDPTCRQNPRHPCRGRTVADKDMVYQVRAGYM